MESRDPPWKEKARHELELAWSAREAGNEGKARVCARRAAGHIAGEYFRRAGKLAGSASAYTRLQILHARPEISAAARELIEHLLLRSTPEFKLPIPVDLLADARQLATELLGEELNSP